MDVTEFEPEHRQCGKLNELLGRIGDRWTLRVGVALQVGPLRFNRIRRAIPGISQQMLTRTLRALERDGMLTRTVYPSVPPQVEYALTPLGRSLIEEGVRLSHWATRHLPEIDLNRANYDRMDAGGPAVDSPTE